MVSKLFEEFCNKLNNNIDNLIKGYYSDFDFEKYNFENDIYAFVQINTIAGDLEYNYKKILSYTKLAEKCNIKFLIFPDLSLTGEVPTKTLERNPTLIKNSQLYLNKLAKSVNNTNVLLSSFSLDKNNCKKKYYLVSNKTIKEYDKNETINISQYKFAIYSDKNITSEADILIDLNSMNCRENSLLNKYNELSTITKQYKKSIIYVNSVGATDSKSYDGVGFVIDYNNNLIAMSKAFSEQLSPFSLNKQLGVIYPYIKNYSNKQDKFSLNYEDDLKRTYLTVTQGIKDYFNKNGIKRACLGLSGGLDSTVCAVLLADAIGKENVIGISMPSKITTSESKNDASKLADNLGITFAEHSIKDLVDNTKNTLTELFDNIEKTIDARYKKSYTIDNIQARLRAIYLWGISNEFESCIPIATSDKSESYMGYATINGDMSGGIAPIADITKTKLFALARWLNKNREIKDIIPESIIQKRPGAELVIDEKTGKPLLAEDALMPYEFLDEVIWYLENKHYSYNDFITHKFIYEEKNAISLTQKQEWLEKFFTRMKRAAFKWNLLPTSIITNDHTINGQEYNYPITSNISFKELT